MILFKCPKCGGGIEGFRPDVCGCGYSVPVVGGVYEFAGDEPASGGDELKRAGYRSVGGTREEAYALTGCGDFGVFGSCARKLADVIGKCKIVLNIGAGLSRSSTPLALAGFHRVVAADISQEVICDAAKGAEESGAPGDKIVHARMDAYNLHLCDNSVGAAVEVDMIHQADRPELLYGEIKRVLKADGVYVKFNTKLCGYGYDPGYFPALYDIQSFYGELAGVRAEESLSDREPTGDSVKAFFDGPDIYQLYERARVPQSLEMGLYRVKTRAGKLSRLVPADVHDVAWSKAEEYAKEKYGENCFSDMQAQLELSGFVSVYQPIK